MYCPNCGNKVNEGNSFCASCGQKLDNNSNKEEKIVNGNTPSNVNNTVNNNVVKSNNDNTKIYKILSYFGFLFVIGMVVNEKDDKSVRFHVGQGMLVFILDILVFIVNNVIIRNVFGRRISVWGYTTGVYEVSMIGRIIMYGLYLGVFVFSIMGIINAAKNEDKELPIIGSLAFYK